MKKVIRQLQASVGDSRIIRSFVRFLSVGALLYVAAIFFFGWQGTFQAFIAISIQTLLVGAVLSLSSYFWRFRRWEHSLSCMGYCLPRHKHLGIYLSGLAFTATPGKAGETFRSALLASHGVRVTHSVAAFLVDRASDVLGVCLLGALASWASNGHLTWAWVLAFMAMLLGSCMFANLLLHPIASILWHSGSRYLRWLPVSGGRATLEAWATVWRLVRVRVYSTMAMLSYGTQSLVFAWFCQVAGTGLAVADCILIFVQATLFGAATMLPGGLGAMEAALIFQLLDRGVGNGVATSLAIAIRLVTLWLGMSLGALSLFFSIKK